MKKTLPILLLLLLLVACSSSNTYENVNNEGAKALIDDGKVEVIDVRTPEEFAEGHIPEVSLVPLNELEARISELDKDKPYLLVCRSGNRSAQAADILLKKGFTNLYNLQTGMSQWPYEVE